jgi:hypothetical protein
MFTMVLSRTTMNVAGYSCHAVDVSLILTAVGAGSV